MEQYKRLMTEPPWMRKQYIDTKLQDALDSEREEDALRIHEILQNESQKKTWPGIQRVLDPKKNARVTKVNKPMPNGSVTKCKSKQTVEGAIANKVSA